MNTSLQHVLVTGGAGYVGSVLIPKLVSKGFAVTSLDTHWFGNQMFETSKQHPRFHDITGDIRDTALVKKTLQGIDAVIHLACISNDPSFELNPALGKSINFDATCALIDNAKKAGVTRFIYASSSSVYGVKKETEVTENLSLKPLTDYSKYKALCEKNLLNAQSSTFTPLILRPATVCGYSPRMRLDLVVNILTIHALVNNEITVFGGNQYRPNIHIDDITDLYVKSLDFPKKHIAGKIFNVGYENKTLLQLAKMIKKVLKQESITIKTAHTDDIRSYRISSEKINKELGFTPKKTIEDAVLDIQSAYKHGYIPHPFERNIYYNIRVMKTKTS